MGVKIREEPKGSGVFYVFINHRGKRKAKRIGKNKDTARQVAEKIKAKLILGEFDFNETAAGETFKTIAQRWMALPHDWKESTRESYTANLEQHIYPVIGDTPVDQITRKALKVFFEKLSIKGLSFSTLKLVRAPLSGVLSDAVESELIESNPIRDLKMKYKKTRFEIKPYDEPESLRLLDQAKSFMDGNYYPAVLCALRTGMRIGEIQALTWKDVDFEKRSIEVKRSWRKGRTTRPKSKNRRRVDMTPHLTETLKAHKTNEKRKALRAGQPVSEYVFTGHRNDMLNRNTFQNALNRCADGAKLRHIRTHDLRHSYATIRLMRGHSVGDVSYQLGHSSIKITYDVYVHWIPGKFKSEVDDLDNPAGTMQEAANTCV